MHPTRLIAVLLSILILTVSACSRLPGDEPPPTPTVIIPSATPTSRPTAMPTATPEVVGGALTIWHAWGEADLPGLVQILDGFRRQYPETLFDVLYVPAQDLQARYADEVRQGRGPDVLLAPAEWAPTLAAESLVRDLDGLIPPATLSALNKPALQGGYVDERLIGAPYAIQGVVLYRNKDIITISPATFEELVALAQNSTQGDAIGAYLERSFYFSGAHLVGLGGQWTDEDGAPAFDTPEGVAWIGLLQRFDEAGPTGFSTDEDLERFKSGAIGWIIDGSWNLKALAAALGPEKLAIDPWPTYGNGRMAGFVTAEAVYLNANPPVNGDLTARTFVNYLLSAQVQTLMPEAGRIPAVSGVGLTDSIMGPLTAQVMTALAGGAPYPAGPAASSYSLYLDQALRSIFENGMPPQQALDEAAAHVRTEITTTPTP